MVFLAGPPNRGRGAVLQVKEVASNVQQEGIAGVDSEANLGRGVSMNGHASSHQPPQTDFEVRPFLPDGIALPSLVRVISCTAALNPSQAGLGEGNYTDRCTTRKTA